MSGLWMIFLFGFLTDELLPAPLITDSKSETLPKPVFVASNMAGNNAAPQSDPAQSPTIANAIAAEDCKVGWGTDPTDRSRGNLNDHIHRAIGRVDTPANLTVFGCYRIGDCWRLRRV